MISRFVVLLRWIRFSQEVKLLLSKIMAKDPKERITLEDIQKTAWYKKGFETEAPKKYTPITVTQQQLAGAVSTAEMVVEMHSAPAPSGVPTYV